MVEHSGSPNYRIITGEEWSNSFLSKHLTIGGVKLANDSSTLAASNLLISPICAPGATGAHPVKRYTHL